MQLEIILSKINVNSEKQTFAIYSHMQGLNLQNWMWRLPCVGGWGCVMKVERGPWEGNDRKGVLVQYMWHEVKRMNIWDHEGDEQQRSRGG